MVVHRFVFIMGATKEVNAASAYRIYCQLRD